MFGLWVGPLERGAVTGVHETDTLLCATKTCSHVCAASAPASVWFSCFTAHRKNALVARKVADEKSRLRSFPKVPRGITGLLARLERRQGPPHVVSTPPFVRRLLAQQAAVSALS